MIHVWECFDLVVLDSLLFPMLLIFVFRSSKRDVCSSISGKIPLLIAFRHAAIVPFMLRS